ncbi:hypothetical protein [Methylosinus sp. Ce-a6]|uniref:hypothetical protein n=1 Tax=Methylosinus sp. Ce-a6 TaxID=2172005 RepID=UPI0013579B5F|nr:hypothetical protein [Methylosinus sp. Ce-a6]
MSFIPDWLTIDFLVQNVAWDFGKKALFAIVTALVTDKVIKTIINTVQPKAKLQGLRLIVPMFCLFFFLSLLLGQSTLSVPSLEGNIVEIAWGGDVTSKSDGNQLQPDTLLKNPVLLVATIKNRGNMPSVVDNYSLELNIDGQSFQGKLVMVPNTVTVDVNEKQNLTLFGTDALYDKTRTPIYPGSMITGVLLFSLDEVSASSLKRSGISFNLKYKDINGRENSILYKANHRIGIAGYIPGIKQAYSNK